MPTSAKIEKQLPSKAVTKEALDAQASAWDNPETAPLLEAELFAELLDLARLTADPGVYWTLQNALAQTLNQPELPAAR